MLHEQVCGEAPRSTRGACAPRNKHPKDLDGRPSIRTIPVTGGRTDRNRLSTLCGQFAQNESATNRGRAGNVAFLRFGVRPRRNGSERMKRYLPFPLITLAFALLVVPSLSAAAQRPNILLIVADDLGYGELSCQGNPQIPTPISIRWPRVACASPAAT